MSTMARLQGMYPALITPFTADGALDEAALKRLVAYHVEQGTNGLFLCGSLGTGVGMSAEERRRVVDVVMETGDDRLGIIVHVGSLNPLESSALARHAESSGADAVAAITPYYYRVTWPVVRAFYDRLLDATRLPVWAYNQPMHTYFELSIEHVLELAERGVRGYKDGGLSFYAFQQVLRRVDRAQFTVFTAVPSTLFAALADGADGFIGGPNNAVPQFYNALYAAVRAGEWERAVALERWAGEVFRLCGGPGNVPMWHALLTEFGVDSGLPRLPMPPITEEVRAGARANTGRLRQILKELQITG
jgi:dihydrodipicolinate synthase/N-acetylneuraminate lyase